jgi:N utilization substance protein A
VEVDDKQNQAKVVVPEDQLSLTIGIEGQNVRLAARLTGWKIDVVTQEGKTPEDVGIDETKVKEQEEQRTHTTSKDQLSEDSSADSSSEKQEETEEKKSTQADQEEKKEETSDASEEEPTSKKE